MSKYSLKTKTNTRLIIWSPSASFIRGMSVDVLVMDNFEVFTKDIILDFIPILSMNNPTILGTTSGSTTEGFNYIFNDNPLNCNRLIV